jgi:magnesium transporter
MITVYSVVEGKLIKEQTVDRTTLTPEAVWIDLFKPTPEEERAVESTLGINIPTPEEMQEIEATSRLYREGETSYMTLRVLYNTESARPESSDITFILTPTRLITLRYADPRSFQMFSAQFAKQAGAMGSGSRVLIGLLEAIVDRFADILEQVGLNIDTLSQDIFDANPEISGNEKRQERNLREILRGIGQAGNLISKARESLFGLSLVVTFLSQIGSDHQAKEVRAGLKNLTRDIQSLSDHDSFLSGKVTFLLDATLGMINMEQNDIIKIFSVVAVVFLPPTLIASIYGMNFELMPELDWRFGYPLALALMVGSAIAPYLFFKRRGWL